MDLMQWLWQAWLKDVKNILKAISKWQKAYVCRFHYKNGVNKYNHGDKKSVHVSSDGKEELLCPPWLDCLSRIIFAGCTEREKNLILGIDLEHEICLAKEGHRRLW